MNNTKKNPEWDNGCRKDLIEKTVLNCIKVDAISRKIEISKKSYDTHSILTYIFIRPQKKRICLREIRHRYFVFKNIKFFFMYLNPCRNMYAKLNFNIFNYFSLMKSIK